MAGQARGERPDSKRLESGLHKLGRFVGAAKLPQAQQFLDAIDLSAADRALLARAVDELYRPTSLDSERLLLAFPASHSPTEVTALSDLGNRLVESHSQFLAVGAWGRVFTRLADAPAALQPKGLEGAIADYLQFAAGIGRRALEADQAAGLDGLEGTHAQLATTARWQRLRTLLRAVEERLGDRRDAFLAWARSIEPERAEVLMPLADLERLS